MMQLLADLHLHSHYSVATSKQMDPENIHRWAQLKGLGVVGTGDCTHPGWLAELEEKLEPAEPGLYRLKAHLAREVDAQVPARCRGPVRFLVSGEVSSIFKRDGKVRKVHSLVLLPDLETAAKLQATLARMGNISSDGRPILGLDAKELLVIIKEIEETAILVPAHAWTPHFSVLGARSGFDSLEECFEEMTPLVRAVETGLSSDPPMNWRLTALDRVRLISNSDAHSPSKLMREANILQAELSYAGITAALTGVDGDGLRGTVEFFPEEGKYHFDGHRACGQRLSPEQTRLCGGRCPHCGRPVTKGVLHRVEELADCPLGRRPAGAAEYVSLIPLQELIAEALGMGAGSKKVIACYLQVLEALGPEYQVLVETKPEEIAAAGLPVVAAAVDRVRRGAVHIKPGFDGEFGRIHVFAPQERQEIAGQLDLFA